jgi:hypothetical protein
MNKTTSTTESMKASLDKGFARTDMPSHKLTTVSDNYRSMLVLIRWLGSR